MKKPNQLPFWQRRDTFRLGRMVLLGFSVGVIGRYVYVSAPPLPVQAAGARATVSATNAPAALKSAGASPSVRD